MVPADEPTPRIVEAVFASANTGGLATGAGKSSLAKLIEQAMAQAVDYCYSHGINEPEEVRAHMLLAREDAKKKYAEAVEAAMRNLAR